MTDAIRAEIDARPVAASVSEVDGNWVLTMVRDLPHPVESVWPKLTEPDQLATWSPVVPDRPLTTVGPATARENPGDPPVDAEVLVCEPPRELVHRWGPHQLRWTLTPTGTGTRLTLEHTFEGEASMFGAGWHICLAVLAVRLAGRDVSRVTGPRAMDYGWEALNKAYAAVV